MRVIPRRFNRGVNAWTWMASVWVFGMLIGPGYAQNYPARPIRVVVTAPAGGGTDLVARLIGTKFQESLGEPWIIDNRGGANGIIGTELIARAAPDGYSVVMVYVSHAVNPGMYGKLPYDTLKDFEAVTQTTTQPLLLVVHPSLPVRNVRQLIALAKARPGELIYGSSGSGTGPHLAMALLAAQAGARINHIPFKGSGTLTSSVIAGEVPIAFFTPPPSLSHVRAGRMRAIAVSGAKRSPMLPEVPTVAESGYPAFEASTWFGLLAPAGTPRNIVAKLHTDVARILRMPDVTEKLAAQGVEPVGSTPEEFANHIRAEMIKWDKVVKASGARVD